MELNSFPLWKVITLLPENWRWSSIFLPNQPIATFTLVFFNSLIIHRRQYLTSYKNLGASKPKKKKKKMKISFPSKNVNNLIFSKLGSLIKHQLIYLILRQPKLYE